jgi:hypothetical protein
MGRASPSVARCFGTRYPLNAPQRLERVSTDLSPSMLINQWNSSIDVNTHVSKLGSSSPISLPSFTGNTSARMVQSPICLTPVEINTVPCRDIGLHAVLHQSKMNMPVMFLRSLCLSFDLPLQFLQSRYDASSSENFISYIFHSLNSASWLLE